MTSEVISDLLATIAATPTQLHVRLLQPLPSSGTNAAASGSSFLPTISPTGLQLARLAVNAVLHSTKQLATDGWTSSALAGSQLPTSKSVLHLFDAFRISTRAIFLAAVSKDKPSSPYQLPAIMSTIIKRGIAFQVPQLTDRLASELAYLRSQILQVYTGRIDSADDLGLSTLSMSSTPSPEMLLFDAPTGETDEALINLVLDVQGVILQSIASSDFNTTSHLQQLVDAVEDPRAGVLAWKARAEQLGGERSSDDVSIKLVQRTPLLAERSVTNIVTRLWEVAKNDARNQAETSSLILRARRLNCMIWLDYCHRELSTEGTAAKRAGLLERIPKMTIAHWRGCPEGREAKAKAYKEASAVLEEMTDRLKRLDALLPPDSRWSAMPGWGKLLSDWRWLAEKNEDYKVADRLTLEASPALTIDATADVSSKLSSMRISAGPTVDAHEAYNGALTACLRATPLLDRLLNTSNAAKMDWGLLDEASATLAPLQKSNQPGGAAKLETQINLLKELDRMRRRCCLQVESLNDALDKGDSAEKLTPQQLQSLLRLLQLTATAEAAIVVAFDQTASPQIDLAKHFRGSLQGLRILALHQHRKAAMTKTADDSGLDTFEAAIGICSSFQASLAVESPLLALSGEALVGLSANVYSIGGQFYARKEWSRAAPYIASSARAAEQALALDGQSKGNSIATKWEYAAACYRSTSRKGKALQALGRALASIPKAQYEELLKLGGQRTLDEIFVVSSVTKEKPHSGSEWSSLDRILRTMVELSVFDLLADQAVPDEEKGLVHIFRESQLGEAVIALLIERIVTSEWLASKMHGEGAEEAVASLMEDALSLTSGYAMPIRRARLLLLQLERTLLSGRSLEVVGEHPEQILALLQQVDLRLDEGLRKQLPIHLGTLRLLDVMRCHRDPSRESCSMLSTAAKAAAQSLSMLCHSEETSPVKDKGIVYVTQRITKPRAMGPKVKAAAAAAAPPRSRREPLKSSAVAKQSANLSSNPVTPPRRPASDFKPLHSLSDEGQLPRKMLILNFDPRLVSLLQLVCNLLAAHGHCLESIELLKYLRRCATDDVDLWTQATVDLAKHYLTLGRLSRAQSLLSAASSKLGPIPSSKTLSAETRFSLLLVQSQAHLSAGKLQESRARYDEAVELCKAIAREEDLDACGSGLTRALSRIADFQRVARTSGVFAELMLAKGDLRCSIEAGLRAGAFSSRAVSLLNKVTSRDSSAQRTATTNGSQPSSDDDRFFASRALASDPAKAAAQAQDEALQTVPLASTGAMGAAPKLPSYKVAAIHWSISQELISAHQRLARLHQIRGSARDALSFATEAVNLTEGLSLGVSWAQSLLLRAEIQLLMGNKSAGEEDVARSLKVLSDVWLPEAAALACIQGDQLAKDVTSHKAALKAYNTGQSTLRALEKAFVEVELVLPSPTREGSKARSSIAAGKTARTTPRLSSTPRSTSVPNPSHTEGLLPQLQARLLHRQAWLLQALDRTEESEGVLEQANALTKVFGAAEQADVHLLQGRLTLQRALRQIQQDPVWGMISESAISLPMMSSSAVSTSSRSKMTAPTKAIVGLLKKASSAFSLAVSDAAGRQGASIALRTALQGIALTSLLQATMAEGGKGHMYNVTSTLCSAAAVTLQREAVQAIWSKLAVVRPMDQDPWADTEAKQRELPTGSRPSLALAKGPVDKTTASRPRHRAMSQEASSDEDEEQEDDTSEDAIMLKYWQEQKARSQDQALISPVSEHTDLPNGWTVVSISLSKERNCLTVSRQSGCSSLQDVVFSLPIDRQARREGEEEELTAQAALEELRDIQNSSNRLTSSAKDVSLAMPESEKRRLWWTSRRELDDRLKQLCEGVESRWLGPFKSIFMDPIPVPKDSRPVQKLRAAFDLIVRTLCYPSSSAKKSNTIKLDDAIFETVAGLSPSAVTDEELEDLLHFIMDAHQFNGVPVAVDEADLDELTVNLRLALIEFRSACSRDGEALDEPDHHIFLICDKDAVAIPWESLPILRGRPVCRIPSLSFLHDRVQLARRLGASQDDDGAFHLSTRSKAFYLLNPGGDLLKSQARFEPYLKSNRHWRGVMGHTPGPTEFVDALASNPLVMYFGHGGAEQYARGNKIRSLKKCAVTMLWGCSSAILKDQGDFDRTGTPYNYMLAGCPAMVGQLIDATDKELDCVSEAVLLKLGLKNTPSEDLLAAEKCSPNKLIIASRAAEEQKRGRRKKMSLARAVAESRDSCRLPYLTGAAPVVWGVPVYFDRE